MKKFIQENVGYIISAMAYLCLAQTVLGIWLINRSDLGDSLPFVAITGLSAGIALSLFGAFVGIITACLCDVICDWHDITVQMHGGNLAFCLAISYFVLLPFGGPAMCLCAALVYAPFILVGIRYDTNTAFRNACDSRLRQMGCIS